MTQDLPPEVQPSAASNEPPSQRDLSLAQSSYEYDRHLYEVFQAERQSLTEAERSLDKAINTAVLTVSGAALGISLTIVKEFDQLGSARASPTLAASWISLVLALLGSLFTLKMNQETHNRFRTILEEEFATRLDGALERSRQRQRSCVLVRILRVSDWLSVALCLLGVSLLFVFAHLAVARGGATNARGSATAIPTIAPHPAAAASSEPTDADTEGASSGAP